MSISADHYKIREVHANKEWPCPFGCIYVEYEDGTLQRTGDCRMPESHRCCQRGDDAIRRLQKEAAK